MTRREEDQLNASLSQSLCARASGTTSPGCPTLWTTEIRGRLRLNWMNSPLWWNMAVMCIWDFFSALFMPLCVLTKCPHPSPPAVRCANRHVRSARPSWRSLIMRGLILWTALNCPPEMTPTLCAWKPRKMTLKLRLRKERACCLCRPDPGSLALGADGQGAAWEIVKTQKSFSMWKRARRALHAARPLWTCSGPDRIRTLLLFGWRFGLLCASFPQLSQS